MAAFSDVGANCFLESCKEKDFLPFTCDNCGFVFCLEHRTALSHGCPVKPDEHRVIICDKCEKSIRLYTNETETAALTRHSKAGCFKQPPGPRCPVLGCTTKITQSGSVVCSRCRVRTCLAHRYEDAHSCRGNTGAFKSAWKCSRCNYNNSKGGTNCSGCHSSPPRSKGSKFSENCVIS